MSTRIHFGWALCCSRTTRRGDGTLHKDIDQLIDPEFPGRKGQTDSETLFALAMTRGLQEDPASAINEMIREVESLRSRHDVDEPFRMSIAVSDGESLWAARHSSNGDTPTLYWGRGLSLAGADGTTFRLNEHSTVVVSELFDKEQHSWETVPRAVFVCVRRSTSVSPHSWPIVRSSRS